MQKKRELANYIHGALREKESSETKLGEKLGYSQQKLNYRINNGLLTQFELKFIFTYLDTPDEVILKLMKEKK